MIVLLLLNNKIVEPAIVVALLFTRCAYCRTNFGVTKNVDGNWSEWSTCSVTCGSGIKSRTRLECEDDDCDKKYYYRMCRRQCDETLVPAVQKPSDISQTAAEATAAKKQSAENEMGNQYAKLCGSPPVSPALDQSFISQEWSECSSSCGYGRQYRTKVSCHINVFTGPNCVGEHEYRVCRESLCNPEFDNLESPVDYTYVANYLRIILGSLFQLCYRLLTLV